MSVNESCIVTSVTRIPYKFCQPRYKLPMINFSLRDNTQHETFPHTRPTDQSAQVTMQKPTTPLIPAEPSRARIELLMALPNVGKACVADLMVLGITHPQQLIGCDPYHLYEELCRLTGVKHDPCVYDVLISAVRYMEGAPVLPWWHYSAERKAHLASKERQVKY
ncbi:hypothetical protein BH11PSE12_BH11PSE12_08120 [soil metagenome]